MSLNDHSRALYSSFNARALSPAGVASTFVPPKCFFQLANQCHTFVIGPRGSGKTTLLKMLQQPAIEAWQHSRADALRQQVAFTGVFIPTDVTFTSQLDRLSQKFDDRAVIVKAAYSIHVVRAIIQAIEYRTGRISVRHQITEHLRVDLSPQAEREFVLEVAAAFARQVRKPTFGSLKLCMSTWLGDIFALANQYQDAGPDEQRQAIADCGLGQLDLARSPALVIECFENACSLAESRWALLFDELELAPVLIVEELTRLVRSTDPRILFKLSLSPYISGTTDFDTLFNSSRLIADDGNGSQTVANVVPPAQEHEDFDAIRLWAPYKKSGESFCRALANSVIEKKGFKGATVDSVLGPSDFDEPPANEVRQGKAYAPGSKHFRRMNHLAGFDLTFRQYLKRKCIDLKKPITREDQRARTLRKVQGIVIVREAFRKESGGRSRKNPHLYSGARVFYALCESNPRLIIGLLNQLLSDFDSQTCTNPVVDASTQARVYKSVTARFMAYLRTIPSPSITGSVASRGLLDLVKSIGEFAFREVVSDEFSDDPHTSFSVDSNAPTSLQEAIQRAVNAGAIIWVPARDDASLLTSVRGKRFRLSYLLAPRFRLPLQLGRSISLGKILKASAGEDNLLFTLEDEELL